MGALFFHSCGRGGVKFLRKRYLDPKINTHLRTRLPMAGPKPCANVSIYTQWLESVLGGC